MAIFGGRTDLRYCRGIVSKKPRHFFAKDLLLNGNNDYFREKGLLLLEDRKRMTPQEIDGVKQKNNLSHQHAVTECLNYGALSRYQLYPTKKYPYKDPSVGFKMLMVLRHLYSKADLYLMGFTFKVYHGHDGNFERRVAKSLTKLSFI
jgi:hypothetical protein